MSQHTPGPWAVDGDDALWVNAIGREHEPVICDIVPRDADAFTDEDEANARLMAAAPELLEACRDALLVMSAHACPAPKTIAFIEAAIAKATGV